MEDPSEKASILADLRSASQKLHDAEVLRDRLVSDANQLGASTREIAAAAGVHHTTIMRMLRAA